MINKNKKCKFMGELCLYKSGSMFKKGKKRLDIQFTVFKNSKNS